VRGRRVAAALAAALLLPACGGGNGGGGQELTAEEFREQADAICAKYDEQLNELGEPESLEDLQALVDETVTIIENGVAELRELNPPPELEADWDRAMELNEENVELARDLRDAVQEGDQSRFTELAAEAQANTEEGNQLAREMGLEECGEES
jgi:hypothetical protein